MSATSPRSTLPGTVLFPIILIVGLFISPFAEAATPAWLSALVGREVVIAASLNQNNVVYKVSEDRTVTARLEKGLSPLLDSELFRITRVESHEDGRKLEIELYSPNLGDGRLVISSWHKDDPPITESEVDWFIDLLCDTPTTPAICALVGGGAAHYRGSNHCPEGEIVASYDDLEEATVAGLRSCRACFRPIILIEDYFEEMSIGRSVASHVLGISMPVQNDSLQAHLQEVGEDVLDAWPLQLRGYDYRFTVVDMGWPNAVACPGGWIFVSRELLDICETRLELESVLAHEISHVELRHGLQSLRKAKQDRLIGSIFGGLLGAAASSMKDATAAQIGVTMVAVVVNTAMNIAYTGYNRRQEQESDAFAVHYMINRHGSGEREEYGRILRKVAYVSDSFETSDQEDPLASHPTTDSRADFALNADVEIFSPPICFDFTRDGDLALTIDVTGIIFHSIDESRIQQKSGPSNLSAEFGGAPQPVRRGSEMTLFTTVRTTNRLMVEMEIKDVRIRIGEDWVGLDNEEDPKIYPSQVTSVVFRTDRLPVGAEFGTLRPDSLLVSLN